ncbi:MAG: metallophosphoesterase [Myxococcales bacterium]|nr:metallophosphoesterase [Myxococcales bacterium]
MKVQEPHRSRMARSFGSTPGCAVLGILFSVLAGCAGSVDGREPDGAVVRPRDAAVADDGRVADDGGPGDGGVELTKDAAVPDIPVVFSAAGDHGWNEAAEKSLDLIVARKAEFHLALGDASYGLPGEETQWCSWVKSFVGDKFPFQLIAGNHEEDNGPNGHISKFVGDLPDRMNSVGIYGAQYYFDVRDTLRVIMIAADLDVDGVKYDYEKGTSFYGWLETVIDDARAKGVRWVVVGMHKNCITAGEKSCEIGPDLMDMLIEKRVDIVFQGHEHLYERSKQVSCAKVGEYLPGCVVDDGSDGTYTQGKGTVFVVSGSFGKLRDLNLSDPEYPYFAESDDTSNGVAFVEVNRKRLRLDFAPSKGAYTDAFEILAE